MTTSRNKSFVRDLTPEILFELNKKIRDSGYGKCIEIAEWLCKKGFHATKSGVNRYSVKLKQSDGIRATSGSFEAIIAASGDGGPKTESLGSLLEQLGRLEFQKSEIIKKISYLNNPDAS